MKGFKSNSKNIYLPKNLKVPYIRPESSSIEVTFNFDYSKIYILIGEY